MKLCVLFAALTMFVFSVQAETIIWSSELLASDGSNVLADGTVHVGVSYGSGFGDSRTINGVNFLANVAAGNHDNPVWSGFIDNRNEAATRYGAAGTALKELANDIVYGPVLALGINNLTIGNRYRIQLISYDASNWWNSPEAAIERWQTITATGGAGFNFQHGTQSPYAGINDVGAALVIGTWTASETEIDFAVTSRVLNDNAILNAFVVQNISPTINVAPVHNSQGVALDAALIWQISGELTNPDFDVYFGEDKNDVAAGDPSVYRGNQTQTTYTPGSLQLATTYYWRIDAIGSGIRYPGPVWQFTTLAAEWPKCLAPLADMNQDCIVDIADLTLMASRWLEGPGFGLTDADLEGVSLTDFSRLAGDWLKSGSPVVISEFMAANDHTLADNFDVFSDWIEIKNLGDTPQNLKGWYLTDDKDLLNQWAFPEVVINAKGHLVVFASGRNLVNDPDYLHTNFQLDSAGEYLALVRPDLSIAHEFLLPYSPQVKDISYGLTMINGYNRLTAGYFLTPSPGSDNGIATVYRGPYIDGVAHEPVVPGPADTVVVTAKVTPKAGPVDSVSLYYRVMYGAEAAVEMQDDGQHEDGLAGDGIYGGAIPAGTADPGEMLRYYVTAADPNGRDSRNPPVLDFGQDRSPEYYGTVIADPTLTSNLPILYWFVEDPEAARTDAGTRCSAWFNGEFYDNFSVRRRGFTTADWPKRKFKFDFNAGDHFRLMAGLGRVEEIDLQSHQYEIGSTSYMRETIAFQFMRDAGVPAPLAYHIQLRQNGAFYGLYSIIEQVDKDFLVRNGFDAAGLLYKSADSHTLGNLRPNPIYGGYRIAIPETGTYDALAAFCDGINASNSNRLAYVMDHVNLPQVINEMAAHSTMINHDRLPKNYYMYRNPETLEWYRFPWDVEQAFAVGDFLTNTYYNIPFYGDSEHPQSIGSDNYNHLCDAILDMPVTREMFMRRLRTLMDTYLESSAGGYFETLVNNTKNLIEAEADTDNSRWYSGNIDAGVDAILKVSLPARRNQLFNIYGPSGAGYIPGKQATAPSINIGTVEFNPSSYNQDEEYIELINNNSYAVDISGWRMGGGVEFAFQPGTVISAGTRLYVSPNVAAFRSRSVSPKGSEGRFVVGHYKGQLSSWGETLTLTDPSGRVAGTKTYAGNPSDQQRFLRITEIMYHSADPDSGSIYTDEDFDFIELKNIGDQALDLTGVTLTEGIRYEFSASAITDLGADDYIVLAKNPAAFESRYGTGFTVVGPYEGVLDNGGETIKLEDYTHSTILEFDYRDGWYDITDGAGFSLVIQNEKDPVLANWDSKSGWRPSGAVKGSPGEEDVSVAPALGSVVINEVLAHADSAPNDWIELHNTTAQPIHIGGWFLSDSDADLNKYEIPSGTSISANGYLVLTQDDDFGAKFALSENGDEVYLTSLTGYSTSQSFGASENGIALGQHIKSNGGSDFVAMNSNTPGFENDTPKVGPVILGEIMYNPSDFGSADHDEYEYIELQNTGSDTVNLYENRQGLRVPWKLTNGIDYTFPPDTALAPHGRLVVVKNVTAFKNRYPMVPAGILYGPYEGSLSNGGEKLELSKPGDEDIASPGQYYPIRVEMVNYSDGSHPSGADPWPTGPDGTGQSLARKPGSLNLYGNDVINWQASAPTPGE